MKKYTIYSIIFLSLLLSQEHFNVSIQETGESTLFIFQNSIMDLDIGDELGLFDSSGIIDENGNMVIEQAELYVLANHHIKNKRELIEREQVKAQAENQKDILTLKLQYENDKKKLELSFKNNIKSKP